jgi:hypothetical protein
MSSIAAHGEQSALKKIPTYVRVTAAAKRLGWPADRLREMSDAGTLPKRVRPYGRDDYFDAEALIAALAALPSVAQQDRRHLTARDLADQAAIGRGHRVRRRRVRGNTARSG